MHHDTPDHVARVLAAHAPRMLASVLEPAVGRGVLLQSLYPRLAPKGVVVGIDADGAALSAVRERLGKHLGERLRLVKDDFLSWSAPGRQRGLGFECVAMNPPFAGRKASYVALDVGAEFPGSDLRVRHMPVEAAFLLRAVRLLRPGGRLLAILPAAVVSAASTAWLRELLLRRGSIRYVHELPAYTFRAVESRTYLLVYELGGAQRSLIVCNHDLRLPEKLVVERSELTRELRLDFGFLNAQRLYQDLRATWPRLGWVPLGDAADIYRGSVDSGGGARRALHTIDCRDGFWHVERQGQALRRNTGEQAVRRHDLLMKRVARGCAASIGPFRGPAGWACSDCVLVIRPRRPTLKLPLLFAMGVVLRSPRLAGLIERGTGASYISVDSLRDLYFPLDLAARFPMAYREFQEAVRLRSVKTIHAVELRVRQRLVARSARRKEGRPETIKTAKK